MTFDDKYSDSVSLSKILDCFLIEEEKPSVIFTFLSEYDKYTIQDIFKHSLCLPRMLSLSFFYRCSDKQKEKLISLITPEDNTDFEQYELIRLYAYFLWQILRSDLTETIKKVARESILKITSQNSRFERIRHPYSGLVGKRMSEYDYLFIEHPEEEDSVIRALGRMDIGDFTNYMENLSHSLWFMRMFQLDVFESFDIQKQYIFLTKTFLDNTHLLTFSKVYFGFFFQLIGSKVDIEIKKIVYEQIRKDDISQDYLFEMKEEVRDLLNENLTKEELVMRMQLYGIDTYATDIITYFLLKGNKKFLIWLYDNCPEVIKEHLDISDLIEVWKDEKKNK